jgi:hypothetical protein
MNHQKQIIAAYITISSGGGKQNAEVQHGALDGSREEFNKPI